jgi:hypothetical protein
MDNYHDPVRQLKYFRQNLAQNKKSIGFFIAAGCPLSIRDKDNKPLIPDVKGLTSAVSEKLKDDADYKKLIEELVKAGKNKENIEDILSFIRALSLVVKGNDVRGFNEVKLLALEKSICKTISDLIDVKLPTDTTPYQKLVSWISSTERVIPIELFTTNYDLIMEKTLEQNAVPYFDGFVGSTEAFFDLRAVEDNLIPIHWIRLWKIHGSINWKKNDRGEVIRVSNPKDIESNLIYPSHLKYDESRKMPYLALIDKLNKFLKGNPTLLIMSGYSFSDDHLNYSILNALKANPTANVIALLFGSLKDYPKAIELAENRRHNLSLWAFDEAVIGAVRGEWKISNTNNLEEDELYQHSKSSLALVEKEAEKISIELGNFQVLGGYLQALIGREDSELK